MENFDKVVNGLNSIDEVLSDIEYVAKALTMLKLDAGLSLYDAVDRIRNGVALAHDGFQHYVHAQVITADSVHNAAINGMISSINLDI